MTTPFKLQHVSYVPEGSWGEASTSMTGAQQLPVTATVDVSGIGRQLIETGRVEQYRNRNQKRILGTFAGEFTIELELVGHGAVTSGSVTATAHETIIGWALGELATPTAGTTVTGGTAAVPTVSLSSGYAPGALVRIGTKGDANCDGQWGVVGAHSSNSLTLKTAAPAAPTVGAVVHSSVVAHTAESTFTITSKRFVIKSAGLSWCLHGCYAKDFKITGLGIGQVPKAQITVGVSWIEPVDASTVNSFPDTTTTAAWTTLPAPVTAGSIFLNTFGTATRSIVEARSIDVSVALGVIPIPGYTGAVEGQTVVGCRRGMDRITVSVIVDSEVGPVAAPEWWTAATTGSAYHMLAGLSVGAGSAMALYLPNLLWDARVPTQQDLDGLNRVGLSFVASMDPAGAASLAQSALRLGFA